MMKMVLLANSAREAEKQSYFVFLLEVVPDFLVRRHSGSGVNGVAIQGGEHAPPKHQDALQQVSTECQIKNDSSFFDRKPPP